MHHYNSELDILMSKVKKGQMSRNEYSYIADRLGNKNFLVFGTGHDTDFWRHCNKNGRNIFLEHDKNWILKESQDVFLVEYHTDILQYENYLLNIEKLKMYLPLDVENVNWDLIFVDGPPGNKPTSPGRMQSIYTAWTLCSENTEVFVHDCDRKVEDKYTKHFFEIKKELLKLRHCVKKNEI